jgi:mRNA interferase MazF
VELAEASFERGTLHRTSYARPTKLFTASESVILEPVGTLGQQAYQKLVKTVVELIERGSGG